MNENRTLMLNVADIVDPKTNKTFRQMNSELSHNIPIGTLVELEAGERLFVIKHSRDCDQTALYSLGMIDDSEDEHAQLFRGYSEESLTVVKKE